MHKENVSTSSGSSTYNASTRWVLESKLRQIYAVAGPSWSSTVDAVEFGILSNDVGVDSELKKTEKKDDDNCAIAETRSVPQTKRISVKFIHPTG